jgi:uncharacterized protein YndB with AHSA1/START domain
MTSANIHKTVHVDAVAEREIRTERTFNASRDRVWRALTEPDLIAQWWGRGNRLVIERMEVKRGGHWRYVEHAPDGVHDLEGRYREVVPQERIIRTFDWDGMPGHMSVETTELVAVDGDHTTVTTTVLFHTVGERDGMLGAGMADGVEQSYTALDRVLIEAI